MSIAASARDDASTLMRHLVIDSYRPVVMANIRALAELAEVSWEIMTPTSLNSADAK
jgi:hypothetical protein